MGKAWTKLSRTERRLAQIAAVLAVAFLAYAGALPALAHLRDLDEQVDAMEQEVLLATRQAALSYSVDTRYADLATQHSTDWTEAEIYDGLQRELDRLALRDPNRSTAPGDRLIRIASRPPGHLMPFDGYREYQASFQTQPANIDALVEFVRRLQESPQALRIDRLELKREPAARVATADITVTRTVVDRTGEEPIAAPVEAPAAPASPVANLARNPGFEQWDTKSRSFPGWETRGVRLGAVKEKVTEGQRALQATATQPGGEVFQVHRLPAGRRFKAYLDVAARGAVRIGAKNLATGQVDGLKDIPPGESIYRTDLGTFTVPGKAGDTVDIAVPYITLIEQGAVVFADNLVLEGAE